MTNITALLFNSAPVLVHLYSMLYLQQDVENAFPPHPVDYNLPEIETYDFIVVGGGVAGCVVANLLSEDFKVLLLEAGGEPPPQTYVPAFQPLGLKFTDIIYPYETIFTKDFSINAGGVTHIPLGKALGGTGNLNTMVYNRGHSLDFDNWANITEDESWRYENLLPFFKIFEDYRGQFPSDQHGYDGPFTISIQKYAPALKPWLEAGRELGYNVNKDSNGPQHVGIGPIEFNKKHGRRFSTYEAFLKPILNRKNLKILRYAYVQNVLLSENKKAIGVNYTRHGILEYAYVSKEVILCAGVFGSSQVLLRSGIGPKNDLLKAKIEPKVDLPVGKNLHDHIKLRLEILVTNSSVCEYSYTEKDVTDFINRGYGPLTSSSDSFFDPSYLSGLSGGALIASTIAKREGYPDWADILVGLYSQDFFGVLNDHQSSNSVNRKCPNRQGKISVIPFMTRPKSRGHMQLNSTDINASPLIDFNYLMDRSDLDALINGINETLKLFEETKVYGSIGAKFSRTSEPGCLEYAFRSDAYWECYIRRNSGGGTHPVGTCKMSRCERNDAVVDSKLRVCGVNHLRVIDASIFPQINNSNPQAPIIMFSHKICANILDYWKGK